MTAAVRKTDVPAGGTTWRAGMAAALSSSTAQASVPGLCFRSLCIFNPTLSKGKEERAMDNVLYFYPHETSLNDQMNHVGLCIAVACLSERFSTRRSWTNEIRTDNRTISLYSPFESTWMALETDGTFTSSICEPLMHRIMSVFLLQFGRSVVSAALQVEVVGRPRFFAETHVLCDQKGRRPPQRSHQQAVQASGLGEAGRLRDGPASMLPPTSGPHDSHRTVAGVDAAAAHLVMVGFFDAVSKFLYRTVMVASLHSIMIPHSRSYPKTVPGLVDYKASLGARGAASDTTTLGAGINARIGSAARPIAHKRSGVNKRGTSPPTPRLASPSGSSWSMVNQQSMFRRRELRRRWSLLGNMECLDDYAVSLYPCTPSIFAKISGVIAQYMSLMTGSLSSASRGGEFGDMWSDSTSGDGQSESESIRGSSSSGTGRAIRSADAVATGMSPVESSDLAPATAGCSRPTAENGAALLSRSAAQTHWAGIQYAAWEANTLRLLASNSDHGTLSLLRFLFFLDTATEESPVFLDHGVTQSYWYVCRAPSVILFLCVGEEVRRASHNAISALSTQLVYEIHDCFTTGTCTVLRGSVIPPSRLVANALYPDNPFASQAWEYHAGELCTSILNGRWCAQHAPGSLGAAVMPAPRGSVSSQRREQEKGTGWGYLWPLASTPPAGVATLAVENPALLAARWIRYDGGIHSGAPLQALPRLVHWELSGMVRSLQRLDYRIGRNAAAGTGAAAPVRGEKDDGGHGVVADVSAAPPPTTSEQRTLWGTTSTEPFHILELWAPQSKASWLVVRQCNQRTIAMLFGDCTNVQQCFDAAVAIQARSSLHARGVRA